MQLASTGTAALYLGVSIALGAVLPLVVMRLAIRALEQSPNARTTNYRGRDLSYGLGVVWLVWAVAIALGGIVLGSSLAGLPVLSMVPLALFACAAFGFGLFDDAYGTSAAKGFRGHMRSLAHGVLTTGGLKLIGISAAALAYAGLALGRAPWYMVAEGEVGSWWYWPLKAALFLLAAASVALCGNVLNLMDLRPGRASKAYLALLAFGFVLSVVAVVTPGSADVSGVAVSASVLALLGNLVLLAGPILAVMGLDLAERGMLGDAGANPMGVIAGAYVVSWVGPLGVVAFFVVMLALNIASEKVSFSKVIESNATLSWVDNLGRLTDGSANIESRRTP